MRVAILGLRGIPDVQGGVETHVAHLAPRLVESGLQVEVLGRSPYVPVGSRVWNGVTVTPVWAPRSKALEAIVHTAVGLLMLARRPPDIIHIHAIGPALLAPLARLLGARIVVTHHGFDYDRQKWGPLAKAVLRLGERLGMGFAHARIGVSATIATAMHERYNLPTTFIPNGVAIVPPREGLSVLDRLGLSPRRYILMVARIVEEKRQTDLIAAFARLAEPSMTLVIAGGSEHAGRYLEAVQAAAQAVPNVTLVGVQTGEALAQLYANAALFVLPSSHEGMPIALLEALGYGLPVLASDIAANLALDLGPDAYFPLGDTDALAMAMRAKLAVPHDERRAERQRIAIATRYGWDLVAGQTLAVYQAAMSSGRETKNRRGVPAWGRRVSDKNRNRVMAALGLGFLGLAWAKHRLLGYTTPNRVDKDDAEARIAYLLDVFASIRRFIPPSFDLAGKDVLEMSPGSSRGLGVLFLALGARSYHAIDAFDLAGGEDQNFYADLLRRFEGCGEPDRMRALAATRDPETFGYAVGRDFDIARLAGRRRFDLIVSCAAFEHYDNPRETVASLTQVARPDCETIHIIDMQTHTRWIRDRDPNNIYRFTAPLYRAFAFAGQPNRTRPRSFVSALEDQDWHDVTFTALRTVDPALRTVSLRDLAAPFDEAAMQMDVLNGALTGRRYGSRSLSVLARSP